MTLYLDVFRGFALIVQQGGTNGNKINLKAEVDGHTFTLQILKTAIQALVTDKKITVRQLARTFNDEILKIVVNLRVSGPLVNELKRLEGTSDNITKEEEPYCNEIFVNPKDTPIPIKNLIREKESKLREKNANGKVSKQQTTPRRKRSGK